MVSETEVSSQEVEKVLDPFYDAECGIDTGEAWDNGNADGAWDGE